MAATIRDRIFDLLNAIRADFPRRKSEAEGLMRNMGLTRSLEMAIHAPVLVAKIPTFDPKVFRKPSPMVKARFDYAGTWRNGQDVWLSASQMGLFTKKQSIQPYHLSLREDWEKSAPMNFSDDQLTLFGITEGVPENLIYLVWPRDKGEPSVWCYAGFDCHNFKDLEHYFKWCLERE